MKVYVIYDELNETSISVHKTKKGAIKKCKKGNDKKRKEKLLCRFYWDEFELEE